MGTTAWVSGAYGELIANTRPFGLRSGPCGSRPAPGSPPGQNRQGRGGGNHYQQLDHHQQRLDHLAIRVGPGSCCKPRFPGWIFGPVFPGCGLGVCKAASFRCRWIARVVVLALAKPGHHERLLAAWANCIFFSPNIRCQRNKRYRSISPRSGLEVKHIMPNRKLGHTTHAEPNPKQNPARGRPRSRNQPKPADLIGGGKSLPGCVAIDAQENLPSPLAASGLVRGQAFLPSRGSLRAIAGKPGRRLFPKQESCLPLAYSSPPGSRYSWHSCR